MKTTQYFLGTSKGIPKNTDIISYQLMLRAGLICKVASGLYGWLPTGLRVLRNIENVIREEMNKIGAIEIFLPLVQPAKLWKMSGRWTQYGVELLRFKNRSHQEYILSPTHEELIASIISKEVVSYKQFPLIVYQIQNKFRDEMRPRYGMFRSREFIMKDGYSFHINFESLKNTYKIIYKTYNVIFSKLGLNYRVIKADPGNTGGNISHEFHAIVNNGEDVIVCPMRSSYSESVDLTEFEVSSIGVGLSGIKENIRLVKFFDMRKITDLITKHNIPKEKVVQTVIVHANKNFGCSYLGLLIRADHELNYRKVEKLPQVSLPLSFASEDEIYSLTGVSSAALGPINLSIPLIADHNVTVMSNFVAGANIDNGYFFGINWVRDLPLPMASDLRKIISGDRGLNGETLSIKHSIEIGHIFQLGNKYLNSLSYSIQGGDKKNVDLVMGCYGIGVSRLIAAVIEQKHDEKGIVWPDILAPFFLAIIPINMYRSCRVAEVSKKIYNQVLKHKIDVLLDDRDESFGVKLSDMELIGIPHCIIISDRSLNNGEVEYVHRDSNVKKRINTKNVLNFLILLLKNVHRGSVLYYVVLYLHLFLDGGFLLHI